jgi:hypothetical protein
MRAIKVTTKTPDEILSVFDDLAKDVKPELRAKQLTQADRLAPYRKAIMKHRRRGLSWKQIAAIMANPRLGEKVSEQLLKKVFGPPPKPVVPVPPKPPRPHLVLDPITGLRISPPPPAR